MLQMRRACSHLPTESSASITSMHVTKPAVSEAYTRTSSSVTLNALGRTFFRMARQLSITWPHAVHATAHAIHVTHVLHGTWYTPAHLRRREGRPRDAPTACVPCLFTRKCHFHVPSQTRYLHMMHYLAACCACNHVSHRPQPPPHTHTHARVFFVKHSLRIP